MPKYHRITLLSDKDAVELDKSLDLREEKPKGCTGRLGMYFLQLSRGLEQGEIEVCLGAVPARLHWEIRGRGPRPDDWFRLCHVAFLCVGSHAIGHQWSAQDEPFPAASEIARVINDCHHPNLRGVVRARAWSSSDGRHATLGIESAVPGAIGNGLDFAPGTLNGVDVRTRHFVGGQDGKATRLRCVGGTDA